MSQHTKEPWKVVDKDGRIHIASGDTLAVIVFGPDVETSRANSRRIVAAVNACAGLSDQVMEGLHIAGETLLDRFNLMRSDAAEDATTIAMLLAAMEAMVGKATKQNWNDLYPEILKQAFAAIAKARGGA